MAEDQHGISSAGSSADKPAAASVLRRKAAAGRAEQQARAMSLAKALRLSLAKVADDLVDLAMATLAVRSETRSGDALDGVFEATSLLMLLDGPGGQRGAVSFDPLLVGALIQQQTMGQVLPDSGGEGRGLTATDAAICVPFLDALLARASSLPDAAEDRRWLEGFRFGSRAENPRLVQLALEASDYRILRLTVDIAGGIRQGQIALCLPLPNSTSNPAEPAIDAETPTSSPTPKLLLGNVMGLKAELNIALARLKLPLGGFGALKAGDLLPLPGSSFEAVTVITKDGRGVAQGALGQVGGQRAVRLSRAPTPMLHPRRRASDRHELDLPEVVFDRRQPDQADADRAAEAAPLDLPLHATPQPEEDTADMPNLPELPELPDMSDLTDFDADDAPPQLPAREAG